MSWKKFSSNNNRKGVENNSKQKSSIYASKVFTNDIIVNNEADVGEIDFSNLNFTKDIYKADSINILEFMHGTDISVNQIGVQNNVDTSGVVKIIKPIKAYVGLFNKLKGFDASFEKLNVNTTNVHNISSNDRTKIEIKSDVTFNDVLDFNDISMNHFNFKTSNEVIISADISISTLDKSLKFKDASINSVGSRSGTNIIRFDKDISLNGSIFSIGVSADELIVSDMSVNVIEAKDTSVNITNDISVNGNINIDKINLDFITTDVSIQNDLSINGDLCCNHMKIDGNIDKFDNNSLLKFTHTVSFENTLVKSDISATTITFNTGSNKVPTTEIIPDNPKNIITYGLNSYSDSSCIVIDGDVSINGKLHAEWDKTGMNIIPTLTSNLDLIKNIDDYNIGQFVMLKIGNNEKIFIKSGEKSWHNLVIGNASPFYTKFELLNNDNDHIFINNPDYETILLPDNSYTDLNGLEGTEIVFYVEKKYDLSNEIFTLDIRHNDPEDDAITSFFDNSFSNYLGGAGWGISLDNATDTTTGTDISVVKILPPINNGFDFSFTVTIEEDRTGLSTVPIEQKVIFKKKNDLPQWRKMIMDASTSYSIASQVWTMDDNQGTDISYTFSVRYLNPETDIGKYDTSYYILDLSSRDPEGFDVSYMIKSNYDTGNLYVNNDWSWNIKDDKVYIKIPGIGHDKDFSFEIISHDNIDSNISSATYFNNIFDNSKRIVKFKKEKDVINWGYIARNTNFNLFDDSWNTASWNNTNNSSSPAINLDVDVSYTFYYASDIESIIKLDISSTNSNYFDVSYNLSFNLSDVSYTFNDYQLDISKSNNDISFEITLKNNQNIPKIVYLQYDPNAYLNALFPQYRLSDKPVLKSNNFTMDNNNYVCFALPKHTAGTKDFSFNHIDTYIPFTDVYFFSFSAPGDGGAAADGGSINSDLAAGNYTRAVFSGATGGGGARSTGRYLSSSHSSNAGVSIETQDSNTTIIHTDATSGLYSILNLVKSTSGDNANNFVVVDKMGIDSDLAYQNKTIWIEGYFNVAKRAFNGGGGVGWLTPYPNSTDLFTNNTQEYSSVNVDDELGHEIVTNYNAYSSSTDPLASNEDFKWTTPRSKFVSANYDIADGNADNRFYHVRGEKTRVYDLPSFKNWTGSLTDLPPTGGAGGGGGGAGEDSIFRTAMDWPESGEPSDGFGAEDTAITGPSAPELYDSLSPFNNGPGGALYYLDDAYTFFISRGDMRVLHRALPGGIGEIMNDSEIRTLATTHNQPPPAGLLSDAIVSINNIHTDFSANFYNQTSGGDGQSIVNNINTLHSTSPYQSSIYSYFSSLNQNKYIPDYPHIIIYKLSN